MINQEWDFLNTHPACKALWETCQELPMFICLPGEKILIKKNEEQSEMIQKSVDILSKNRWCQK